MLLPYLLLGIVASLKGVFGGCDPDWSYHNGHCYWSSLYQPTSRQQVNWFHGQIQCRKLGADLVSIQSASENHFVYKLTRCSNTWNGLVSTDRSHIGSHSAWNWINTFDRNYINWYSGFPRASSGYNMYSCSYLSTGHSEKWLQGRCGYDNLYYVCKKQATGSATVNATNFHKVQGACKKNWFQLGSKCYRINATKVDFFAALLDCQSHKAKLVTLHGTRENADLTRVYDECSTPWIGLENTDPNQVHKNTGWRWNDNTHVDYSNWESTVPTNDKTKQCVTLQGGSKWRNRNCWELHPFVCESGIPDTK